MKEALEILWISLALSAFFAALVISLLYFDKKKNSKFRNTLLPGTKVYVSLIQSNFEGIVVDTDAEFITITSKVRRQQVYPTLLLLTLTN